MLSPETTNAIETNDSLLIETQYLPPVSTFISMQSFSKIIINGNEKFVKSSNRNRCKIVNANGSLILSIPLVGGRGVKALTKDIRISYDDQWQKKHWRGITSAYGKSSYFLFYEERFRNFYEKKYEFLIDFNTRLLEVCLNILGMKTIIEIQNSTINSKHQQPATNSSQFKLYHQVFEERLGFIADASIIDLIFNMGNEAGNYLRGQTCN